MAADLDGAAARVGMWLRSTVPGDLARAVGETYTVRTDDVAAVLDALDATQRDAAAERARADAAEGECARLRLNRSTVDRLAAAWAIICRAHSIDPSPANADRVAGVVAAAAQVRDEAMATRDAAVAENVQAHRDRDAAVARHTALAGAVRAAVEHERAVTQRERDEIGAGWLGDLADVPVVAVARAALDALLTEGEVGDGR